MGERTNGLRQRLGFRDGDKGTHSSRTLMLAELEQVLEATPQTADIADYRRAVVSENVLGKRTHTTREHTVRKLKALYGLDPAFPVFRALRWFWQLDIGGRPLLAMLCGHARDPLLRLTADAILVAEVGSSVHPDLIEQVLRERAPGRFSENSERSIARNVLSSWTQSGHLAGHTEKSRARPKPTPGSTAYALFLAYLEGRRAQRLFDSPWGRILDAPEAHLMDLAAAAGRRGWIDHLRAGGVIELRFPNLLSREELELIHEQ
ncbi:MAG: hypothetical protein HYV63_05750 [Candidatus Schekmanbacteria bacterium]|nr:hypothetical protein [Candidatus Schekmanbacteria bacterium]